MSDTTNPNADLLAALNALLAANGVNTGADTKGQEPPRDPGQDLMSRLEELEMKANGLS